MGKRGLTFLAAVLTTGIVVVPFLGLDDLPRTLRSQIRSEREALSAARTQMQRAQQDVDGDLRAEPDLFRAVNIFPERIGTAAAALAAAGRDMADLDKLYEANRRQDRARAEELLARETKERASALTEAGKVQADANLWVERKRNLPQQLEAMERDYKALRAADLTGIGAAVQKAENDWPEKKADLESRLAALRAVSAGAEKTWRDSEPLRRKAEARDYAGLDYAALFTAADSLRNGNASLPGKVEELKKLTGQLYFSWDKLLVDLEKNREKIRTVRTRLADSNAKNGEVGSDEEWIQVSRAQYAAIEKNLGMAVEHKSAGKYDFEAERTPQPAGFAYMAPPSQGSNQYGYWDHRGGQSFWVFYGQYALMRDLLFNRDYRPLDTREWNSYRDYQRSGRTYYGRDEHDEPKYGTGGTATQSRYAGSTYAHSGGFSDSKYATKSGSYRGSQYQSRGSREHPEQAAPRSFGSSRSPSRSWSPPRSSPRPSGGRTFGGRRR
jgi:hypothetical protein